MKVNCKQCGEPLGIAAGQPEDTLTFCSKACVCHFAFNLPADQWPASIVSPAPNPQGGSIVSYNTVTLGQVVAVERRESPFEGWTQLMVTVQR